MTLTKGKHDTREQSTLANGERPFKGSNGHETMGMKQISTGAKKWSSSENVLTTFNVSETNQ